MTSMNLPEGEIQPLSVGNVVSAGIRLYVDHFRPYLKLSLIAMGWLLLPFVVLALLVGGVVLANPNYAPFGLLGFLVFVPLLIFGTAKYQSGAAAISRLAFSTLTNQPEPARVSSRYTDARKWSFWIIGFLVSLLFSGATLAFFFAVLMLMGVVFGIALAVTGSSSPEALFNNPWTIALTVLVMLVALLLFLLLAIWLAARFTVAELPMAVEPQATAVSSVGRSWDLTQRSVWRIVLILFVTFLITFPVQLVVQIFTTVIQVGLALVIPQDSSGYTAIPVLASYLLGLASGIVLLPLWQAIKAVIYYDLRSRREGLGLELPERDL